LTLDSICKEYQQIKSQGTELNLLHLKVTMILMHDKELSYGGTLNVPRSQKGKV
jgi:hypothetical protein